MQFALRILKLCQNLPKTDESRAIARQLVRSGTSVGANYRSVVRARSRPEFISKLGIVVEEADETVFWLELLVESGIVPDAKLKLLLQEANELLAMFAAAQLTAKANKNS
jgi:four helix bundle protein